MAAYGLRGSTRFHVPGHKGGGGADPGLRSALGDAALLLDVPQDIEGIDLGPSPTPYERAERLAAEAYGAERCWFLTNGATQGNHALCLALAGPGTRVLIQRNSHASMIDGLVLSGGLPQFRRARVRHGARHGTRRHAGGARGGARGGRSGPISAAFIVSPTYYGMAADVAGCAEVAHARRRTADRRLRLGLALRLPRRRCRDSPLAARRRRDARLDAQDRWQPHAVGDAARAHDSGRVDVGAIARAVRLVRSTSPSSLLMASLDAARRQLAVHGELLLDRTIQAAARAREAIDEIPGCTIVGEQWVGRPGIAGWDPLRIVIDVRGTGLTGYEVASALRASYDIHVELATHATVVLVLGHRPAA